MGTLLRPSLSNLQMKMLMRYYLLLAGLSAHLLVDGVSADGPCSTDPCTNDGVCVIDNENNPKCDCAPGFTGTFCVNEFDECESNPCQAGGICIDAINSFVCNCANGRTGDMCEKGPCSENPCENESMCLNRQDSFECSCASGWTGEICTEDADDCTSQPCTNGGSCVNGRNLFYCECAEGYSGDRCQTGNNASTCSSNPCLNSGVCSLSGSSYSCTCVTPFSGKRCEIPGTSGNMSSISASGTAFDVYWIIVIVILAVAFIFTLFALLYYKYKPKDRSLLYDAEEATKRHIDVHADESYDSSGSNAMNKSRPDTENDYGFTPPHRGSRPTVAEVNSYENPWPVSTEDFEQPRTSL